MSLVIARCDWSVTIQSFLLLEETKHAFKSEIIDNGCDTPGFIVPLDVDLIRCLMKPAIASGEARMATVSREFLIHLKLHELPAYKIAQWARVNPTTLSRLIHGIDKVQPSDPRIIAVGKS